jgi:hypothetical protein
MKEITKLGLVLCLYVIAILLSLAVPLLLIMCAVKYLFFS